MGCYGIDIASYQGSVYDTAGRSYVFVKATEGTGYVNPRHDAQVAYARAQGRVVGHYHFARPGDMPAQVDYFLRHASPEPGDILCLDWEDSGVSGADKDAWIKAAQKAAAAHEVILYCDLDFWRNHDRTGFAGDGLWIADPGARAGYPRVQAPWIFHQYGESNGTDLDFCNLTADALRAWAHAKEGDMALTDAEIDAIALKVWQYTNRTVGDTHDMHQAVVNAEANSAKALAVVTALQGQVSKLTVGGVDEDALATKVVDLFDKRLAN